MLPIIALALQYAPSLIGLLADEIQAQIAGDKSKADQFIAKLQSVTDQFKISVEDTQDARHQTIQLAASGSAMAWGAVVVSVLVTLAFTADLAVLCFVKMKFDDITGQVFILLTGTLSAAFTQVVSYWLGSSAGSANKDSIIAAMSPMPSVQPKKK
jgi:hypothetical protein